MTNLNLKVNHFIISDVHLGHPRTETKHITTNIDKLFYQFTKPVDMFVVTGDLFDRSLSMSSIDANLSFQWACRLLDYCSLHNIAIRILEGTPSHDRKQADIISHLFKTRSYRDCDFKYVSDLHIETNEKTGLTYLYIPDEYNPSTEKTYEDVLALMKHKGLDKVDFVFMHGQFRWQLPEHIPAPKHVEEDYLRIVRHKVICGHVHTHSTYDDTILIPGSFDRLKFGEEEAKGGLYVTVTDNHCQWEFIENPTAKKYITYITKEDDTVESICTYLDDVSVPSAVRVFIENNPRLSKETEHLRSELRKKYSGLTIKVVNKAKLSKQQGLPTKIDNDLSNTDLTASVLADVLSKEMGKPLTTLHLSLLEKVNES